MTLGLCAFQAPWLFSACSQPIVGVDAAPPVDGGRPMDTPPPGDVTTGLDIGADDGGAPADAGPVDAPDGSLDAPPLDSGASMDVGAGPDDAGRDGGATDAGPPSCAWDAPWNATLTAVSGLSSAGECEYGPHIFGGELRVLFGLGCASAGGTALSEGSRTSVGAPFGGFTAFAPSIAGVANGSPFLAPSGTVVYWYAKLGGPSADYQIVHSTRTSVTAPFTAPAAAVPVVNSAANDQMGVLGPDGLYFSSDRTGQHEIYFAPGSAETGFATPVAVGAAASGGADIFPVLSADGLTLWWSSDRGGDFDIYVTHRGALGDAFSVAARDATLSSAMKDFPSSISSDGCRLYLTRALEGPERADVYVATRTP